MAREFRLFRLTATTDTKDTTLDKIAFNDPTNSDLKDTKLENALMLIVKKVSTHSIGDNQPAEADLGNKDELGKAEDIYILEAEIKNTIGNSVDGNNAFLALFVISKSPFMSAPGSPA